MYSYPRIFDKIYSFSDYVFLPRFIWVICTANPATDLHNIYGIEMYNSLFTISVKLLNYNKLVHLS